MILNEEKHYDYVLAVENAQDTINQTIINTDKEKRDKFEKYLRDEEELDLCEENIEEIHFVKISIPNKVIDKFAEILKIHVPIKNETNGNDPHITAEFSLRNRRLFESDPWKNDTTNRIFIISYILERQRENGDGIKKLLADGVYSAAYPLHDGSYTDITSKRGKLDNDWASISKWNFYQPINEIKNYFGPKVAIYFIWLGYYMTMLIPASIIGIVSLAYGAVTMHSDVLVNEICNSNVTMCPLCKTCSFWKLSDTCAYSKITYLIDNPVAILNSVFMSVWATLYIETWQRYRSKLIYQWGLIHFSGDDEPDRPEYNKPNKNKKRSKFMKIFFSYTIILFWLLLTLSAIFAIIVYRMAVITTEMIGRRENNVFITDLSADIMNLFAITILNYYYGKLAVWLTDKENLRTAAEYEYSLTLKTYLFKFINYYSAVCYTAFFKGKFVGYPAKYNRIFGLRQEECQPGGCLFELTKQLAVVMIGEKIIDLIIENVEPRLNTISNNITTYLPWMTSKKHKDNKSENKTYPQCYEDYKLHQPNWDVLFNEYLGMIVQYGFISLFIMAFPLAPLLALINNIIELRLDAKKFVKCYRRTVPQRIKDIGVWIQILKLISNLAIASNAFIIAFSSNFIPKYVYSTKFNEDHVNAGYLEFALAHFNVSDFQDNIKFTYNPLNITTCRYPEFRNPPDHPLKYKRPAHYWHIMTFRLAFIIIYHNAVCVISWIIKLIFPSTPIRLRRQMKKDDLKKINKIIKYASQSNKNTKI